VPEYSLTKILLKNGENLPPKKSWTLGNFSLQLHGIFLQTFLHSMVFIRDEEQKLEVNKQGS
jgi:hypothetical protein